MEKERDRIVGHDFVSEAFGDDMTDKRRLKMKKKWCGIGWIALYIIIALGMQFVLSFQLVGAVYTLLIKNGMIQNYTVVQNVLEKIVDLVQQGRTMIYISAMADFLMLACFGTWYYLREKKYSFRPNYKKGLSGKNLLCILGIGFFGQYAVEWLVVAIQLLFPDIFASYEELAKNFDLSTAPPLFMIFSICLFGPLVEEVVFRGMIYGKLRHNGFSLWPAAILSGVAFGAFHMNWVQGIYATVIGIIFAYVYEKTQTIWGTVLLHMAFNSCSYITDYLNEWLMQFESTSLNIFMILFRIISVGIVILLVRQFRTRRNDNETVFEVG